MSRPKSEDSSNPIPEDAQAVFDTVTGPNLRVSDNLIQLVSIVAGAGLGALIGAVWAWRVGGQPAFGAVVGGFFGVVASLLLSGAVIGVVRLVTTARR